MGTLSDDYGSGKQTVLDAGQSANSWPEYKVESEQRSARRLRDAHNSIGGGLEHNPSYARGGAVTGCNGRVTMAQLRKRHGGRI